MAVKKKVPNPSDDTKTRSLAARDFVSVTIYMPRELRQSLKRAAVDAEQPLSRIVIEAMEGYLARLAKTQKS